jgi:hypothetical protein
VLTPGTLDNTKAICAALNMTRRKKRPDAKDARVVSVRPSIEETLRILGGGTQLFPCINKCGNPADYPFGLHCKKCWKNVCVSWPCKHFSDFDAWGHKYQGLPRKGEYK